MRVLSLVYVCLGLLSHIASAKSVFAHVLVGNTHSWTKDTWANDILLAKNAGIDAFVLNIAYPDSTIPTQVANAFAAAEQAGSAFKLLFAFDYVGGGQPWPATGGNSVVSYMNRYKNSPAYFRYNGAPFVSTFEGVNNINDWAPSGPIRSQAGSIYFVPDWTSIGANGVAQHFNNVQGAFSWDMWPNGATNVSDSGDRAWVSKMNSGSKSFMMGVSPWFFHSTNYGKKWVWRGDAGWQARWSQAIKLGPPFVQIVTWNDYGESHYIGPIHSSSDIPSGAADYVSDSPHESWRDFLPYYIAQYKGSSFSISRDQMQYWYRTAPAARGNTCGVVGNNADQGQQEMSPNVIMQDGIFFSALLKAPATVYVQIGNNARRGFSGQAGINHFSTPFNGQTGTPKFSVVRNGAEVKSSYGKQITASTTMSSGCTNYNPWVGSF